MVRRSRGRQRVEMERMQNQNNLQVTFSKRRSGVFKKASELCTLCDVDFAVLVFSPGNKPFSLGHTCVDNVLDRYLGRVPANIDLVAPGTEQLVEAHRNATVRDLGLQLTQKETLMDDEKKRTTAIDKIARQNVEAQGWVRSPYEELSLQQLLALKNGMENFTREIHEKANQMTASGEAEIQWGQFRQLMTMHQSYNSLVRGISNQTSETNFFSPENVAIVPPRPSFGYYFQSGFNFGSNGGNGAPPPFPGGVSSPTFPVNGSVASTSHNEFNPGEASSSGTAHGGIGHEFF